MKLLKISIIFLTIISMALTAFNFLVVLPEYCACIKASENASVEILWESYAFACVGDSAEFSLASFKIICFILIILLLMTILLIVIYRRKKKTA